MARVTATEVKQILDDSALSDAIVDAYIAGATVLVDSALGTGTTDILKQIELWFTAHMITVSRERLAKSEGAGGASITYIGEYTSGLDASPYGQMVKVLDTTGKMSTLGKRAPSITAIKSFD